MALIDDWEIVADVTILGELGEGSYGKVSAGKWNGAPVAVKMLHGIFFELGLARSQLDYFLEKFRDEWQTMKVLRHPNIVQLFGVADARSAQVKIVTELMDESLQSRLKKTPRLSSEMQLHVLRSIVCGLRYLHEHPCGPIVHRDLASKNILLADEASRVKIADLGVAKALGDVRRAATGNIMPGTELYMPPEVRSSVAIHPSLDIFSYGVIIIETLLAKSPSPSGMFVPVAGRPGELRLCTEIERRKTDIQNISSDHPLRQTMLSCLNNNATQRPTADYIYLSVFQHLPLKYDTTRVMRQLESDNVKLASANSEQNSEITKLREDIARLEARLASMESDNNTIRQQMHQLDAFSTRYSSEDKQLVAASANEARKARLSPPRFSEANSTNVLSEEQERPCPPPRPPHLSRDGTSAPTLLFVAKYDFEARRDSEMSFRKGELLYLLDNTNEDWWWAKLEIRNNEGYVPSNYVERFGSLEANDWFYGKITRSDAEKILLLPSNQHGSYLVREKESTSDGYSLSVRNDDTVLHYQIRQRDQPRFYITRKILFQEVADLVAHYQEAADGLCVNLRRACVGTVSPTYTTGRTIRKTSEQWEIARSSIELVRTLGKGELSEIFEGLWNKSTRVAVKTLREGRMTEDEFLEELEIMKKLHHSNIIHLYGACTIEGPIYIVTEDMKNGKLDDYLRGDGKDLNLPQLINMAVQITHGMIYLGTINCIHCDLAARNVLVGESNTVKIGGFRLARIGIYRPRSGTRIPFKWSAPESVLHNKFSVMSDVWSFGILLTELVTHGGDPYPGMKQAQVKIQMAQGYRMSQMDECPDSLYEIMLECWKEVDVERPTFKRLQEQLTELSNVLVLQ